MFIVAEGPISTGRRKPVLSPRQTCCSIRQHTDDPYLSPPSHLVIIIVNLIVTPLLYRVQVVRNDEWDKSGGVGCGMYGNSC